MINIIRKKPEIIKILIGLLFFIAVISRFLFINKTAFFINDQGRDLLVLNKIINEKKLILIGPATSFNAKMGSVYFGPFYYYFLLPFFLINNDPLFITLVFPTLFIIGLVFFWKIKELNFFEKTIFSILIISSSFALYYSRFLWNLNLGYLLSFILFCAFFIFNKKITQSRLLVIIFGFICGMVFQIHYGMLFLYLSFAIILMYKKKILCFAGSFLASFLPFVIFDLRHGHILLKTVYEVIIHFPSKNNLGNISFINIFGKLFESYLFPLDFLPSALKICFGLLVFFSILILLYRTDNPIAKILRPCYILFFITFIIFKRQFDYYLACFYLYFYLGLAFLLFNLFKKNNKLIKIGTTILLLLFIFINIGHYINSVDHRYSIFMQKKLARLSANYQDKNNELSLSVLPHTDDKKGIEYLLLTEYNIKDSPESRQKLIICYSNQCRKEKTYDLIYKEKNLQVFTNNISKK